MTIFEFLDSIFKKNLVDITEEEWKDYSPYMVNRWISMYSPELCIAINEYCNRYNKDQQKEEHYKFLFYLLPKLKNKRIKYIKKIKDQKNSKEDNSLISGLLEMSEKEIENLPLFDVT